MTGIAVDLTAQSYVRELEDRESRAAGVPLRLARRVVARRTGIPAGALENLRRGRTKGVRAWILSALQTALIRELEAEIARDEHEIQLLKAARRGNSDEQVAEILAGIEAKRHAIGESS